MTSPLPPKRRDSRNLADLVRQDRVRLGQLDRGLVGGRFPPARPLKQRFAEGDEDDFDDLPIQFLNSDHATCSANGATIQIPLTHVPEPGSEQVYYNGTPLKWSDWSRTDTVLTIPGEPWFRAGKVAWVDYAYYDQEIDVEPATYDSVSVITADHSSIALPGTSAPGDLLILVISAANSVGCSDPRFVAKNTSANRGVWVGTDDGTNTPVSILMDSVPTAGGADSVAAVMRIKGAPLLPATSEAASSGTGASFSPTIPAAGSFGVIAIASGVGLVTSTINGDLLGNWTMRANLPGAGRAGTSIYLGTAAGLPPAQFSQSGSSPDYYAWVGGLQ